MRVDVRARERWFAGPQGARMRAIGCTAVSRLAFPSDGFDATVVSSGPRTSAARPLEFGVDLADVAARSERERGVVFVAHAAEVCGAAYRRPVAEVGGVDVASGRTGFADDRFPEQVVF